MLKFFVKASLFINISLLAGGVRAEVKSFADAVSQDAAGVKSYFVIEKEESGFRIDEFRQAPNRMQDLARLRRFATLSAALAAMKRLAGDHSRIELRDDSVFSSPTEDSSNVIWPTTREWTWEWELAYGQWVRDNMTTEFFVQYNFGTDCADVVYVMRWIFARQHGLPAANRLVGSGNLFTNESMRAAWSDIPTHEDWRLDQRFRAALNYLSNNTATRSLVTDGYPYELRAGVFTEASHHVVFKGFFHHHAMFVTHVQREGEGLSAKPPIELMYSTMPRAVRSLEPSAYWEQGSVLETEGGLMRFRWPTREAGHWRLVEATQMPYFSREQYESGFCEEGEYFSDAVLRKVIPDIDWVKLIDDGVRDIFARIQSRSRVVEEALVVCARESCEPGTENFENFSTPSRDRRLKDLFGQIVALVGSTVGGAEKWDLALEQEVLMIDETTLWLYDVKTALDRGMLSSDPRATRRQRWGLD